jgi:N-acetylglutamate synthase-like GNAT family acetyltransferase
VIGIEAARATDRPALEGLLLANGLPIAGLEFALGTAVVARQDGRIVGCAAVEVYGSAGLLRSVCVEPRQRGLGLGRRLVEQALDVVRKRGVGEIYLLTETAAEWFPRLGFEPGRREDAPEAIQASPEFTGACPVGATFFRKHLNPAAATAVG